MDHFLRGFTNELTKLAIGDTWQTLGTQAGQQPKPAAGIVRPPSTGVPGAPAPKPTNSFAPTGAFGAAIPTQKLESPAGQKPASWRPSPGYTPKPSSDPASPATPKKRGGGGSGLGNGDVPWETAQQRVTRLESEKKYNAGLDQTKKEQAGHLRSNAGKTYRLTPEQIQEGAKKHVAASNREQLLAPHKGTFKTLGPDGTPVDDNAVPGINLPAGADIRESGAGRSLAKPKVRSADTTGSAPSRDPNSGMGSAADWAKVDKGSFRD